MNTAMVSSGSEINRTDIMEVADAMSCGGGQSQGGH